MTILCLVQMYRSTAIMLLESRTCKSILHYNFYVICTYITSMYILANNIITRIYGTHQLQLKRDTRVPRMCRPRNPHTLLLHACTFVCFYLLHHEHMRKHTSYVCMYTRFFTHAHVSHCVHVKYTQLHFIV